MTDAHRRRPSTAALEAAVAGAAGGALGGLRCRRSASRGRARSSELPTVSSADGGGRTGGAGRAAPLAFVLDSTWAVPMTAAALAAHAVAARQGDRGGYLADLSRRANRHVYRAASGSAVAS